MLKNYFIIAYRNILRNKLRTLVHVLGLSLGVAVCLLVFQVVWFENSFDKFHEDGDRIYQVNTLTQSRGEAWPNPGVPFPLGAVILEEIPELEQKTHFYTLWDVKVLEEASGNVHKNQQNVVMADQQHFEVFPRQWLAGNPHTALREIDQVVLTEASASAYFPGVRPEEVLGKELTYFLPDTVPVIVVGVVADYKDNTDFTFTDFLSLEKAYTEEQREHFQVDRWNSINSASQLFVKFSPHTSEAAVTAKLEGIVDKYYEKNELESTSFSLLPLQELHFTEVFDSPGASREVMKGLVLIGFFILILASMNFINLETAQAVIRSKEVGVRKTMGGTRSQLVLQFLAETAVIVLLAILVGLVFAELLSIYFSDFLPQQMEVQFNTLHSVVFLVVLGLVLCLLSGLLPAYSLAGFQPQRALKGDFKNPSDFTLGYFVRKNLTVVQFAFSIGFIISVLVVSSQIRFMMDKELGFDKEQVMFARLPYMIDKNKKETFKTEVNQLAMVGVSSMGSDVLASTSLWTSTVEVTTEEQKKEVSVQVKSVDEDFLDVYKVGLLAGRNLRNSGDEVLVNETFAANYGNVETALGEVLHLNRKDLQVVGVVPDFHSRSLREEIRPMVLMVNPPNSFVLSVKLSGAGDLMHAKTTLDELYKAHFPLEEADFQFFDESIANFYKADLKLRKVLGMATLMALVISLLGLFALTSFTIAQKTKEISIRKVLGASVREIIYGISKEYVWLVVIAFVLAAAPAWYLLSQWLQEFHFRVDMPLELFALAGLAAMLACLAIVGLHGYKVAQRNPAEVLKSE